MKVLLTRWGLLRYRPILDFYIDWSVIQKMINTEQYIVSRWLFVNLPKIFKNSYVLYFPNGVTDMSDVKRMIKKFETKEEITLSPEKKQEIMDGAQKFIDAKKPLSMKVHIRHSR